MTRGDKRENILQAAEAVFGHRRFHEVTLDEVAAAAHVGKGTIYLYFKNKDDLLLQLVMSRLDELEHHLSLVIESDKSMREKLESFIDKMSTLFRRHHVSLHRVHGPEFEQIQPAARTFLLEHHRRVNELAKKILQEGIEQGEIGPDVDLQTATCMFVSAIHGRNMWFLETKQDLSIKVLVDLFLNGTTPSVRKDELGGIGK